MLFTRISYKISASSTGSQSRVTEWLATAGIIGPIMFALLIALVDVLQYRFLMARGFNPLTTSPVSINALGPYGWIQGANFVVFGLLEIAFAFGLYRSVKGGRLAKITSVGFVFAIGVAMVLSVFPTDNFNADQTGYPVIQSWHGAIHNFAFYMFAFSQLLAMLFMWGRFRKDARWRGFGWYSLIAGVLTLPVGLSLPATDFSWFYVWFVLFPLMWLELVAIRSWSIDRASGTDDEI